MFSEHLLVETELGSLVFLDKKQNLLKKWDSSLSSVKKILFFEKHQQKENYEKYE